MLHGLEPPHQANIHDQLKDFLEIFIFFKLKDFSKRKISFYENKKSTIFHFYGSGCFSYRAGSGVRLVPQMPHLLQPGPVGPGHEVQGCPPVPAVVLPHLVSPLVVVGLVELVPLSHLVVVLSHLVSPLVVLGLVELVPLSHLAVVLGPGEVPAHLVPYVVLLAGSVPHVVLVPYHVLCHLVSPLVVLGLVELVSNVGPGEVLSHLAVVLGPGEVLAHLVPYVVLLAG